MCSVDPNLGPRAFLPRVERADNRDLEVSAGARTPGQRIVLTMLIAFPAVLAIAFLAGGLISLTD